MILTTVIRLFSCLYVVSVMDNTTLIYALAWHACWIAGFILAAITAKSIDEVFE